MRNHRPLRKKEEIDNLLLALEIPANVIHDFYQADVCLDKCILSLLIQRFALSCNTVSGFLRAPNEIDVWLASIFCKLL